MTQLLDDPHLETSAHRPEPHLDVERIARLSREEVDALPYGLMLFDHAGTVHLYNRYEAQLSRRRAIDVVGRSWFREVAPCTRVAAFEGRFRAFVERADLDETLRFEFRFHFLHGAQDVLVTFAHAPEPERVLVVVARRPLSDSGSGLDPTMPAEIRPHDGRARSGLGAALPAPRVFWASAFDAVDDASLEDDRVTEALARGARAWGRAILDAVERHAERVHERPLRALPCLLVAALLDEAFAAQGLGRLELDLGGSGRGVLGLAVRSVDLPARVAEVLYAELLSELVVGLAGRRLAVVPFARHGEVVRFAATTEPKARDLAAARALGIAPHVIARRAGLEVWT